MKNIVLDDALRSKLGDLNERVQLCDEAGNVVGLLLPTEVYHRMIIDLANSLVSDEELDRAFAEPGGKPLQQIKQELGMG